MGKHANSANNKRILELAFKGWEFDFEHIVYTLFIKDTIRDINNYIETHMFSWTDDTNNLRASIGVGVYNSSGALVNWGGSLPDIQRFDKSWSHPNSNRVYEDGRMLLTEALNEFSTPTDKKVKWRIMVYVAMPYAVPVDNSFKGQGWLAELKDATDSIMAIHWAKINKEYKPEIAAYLNRRRKKK